MTRRPWMPLYWGDYFADTRHLSTVQHGAYLLLIAAYWMRGSLPDDDRALANIVGMKFAEWRKVRPTIEAFFQPGWKHKRIEFEFTEALRISEAGRKGGMASAEKRRAISNADLNDRSTIVQRSTQRSANDRSTIGQALHSPSQRKKERKKEVPASDEAMEPIPEPVDEDPKAKLYRIAKTILVSFGIPDKRTGALIGMWLKTRPDPVGLLAAIQYARDQNVAEPVAYITTLVNGRKPNGQHGRRWDPEQVARDLIDEIRERQRAEGVGREDEHH